LTPFGRRRNHLIFLSRHKRMANPGHDLLPLIMTTVVVVIVSLVLVLEQSLEQEQDEQLQRLVASISLAVRRRSRDDGDGDDGGAPKRRKFICYDRKRTRDAIMMDYLGDNPIFDSKRFQRMFRISRKVYDQVKIISQASDPFFNRPEFDVTGRLNICNDAKIMIALKHLAFGVATFSWLDYFQMGESTARESVERLCDVITKSDELQAIFLRSYSKEDAKRVSNLHQFHHGAPGLLGSLDCMHVRWKNCPVALQGAYQGKEKCSTIVLEAVADHNLFFWHTAFGFAGSCNDINILDASPLHTSFVNGAHAKVDFEFSLNGRIFSKPYYLVDGIYPKLSRFAKTISVPLSRAERNYATWQEAARKDVERAFGVLQSKWRLLASPIKKWDEIRIQKMVMACIIMHNMMVEERLDGGGFPSDGGGYFIDINVEVTDDGPVADEAEERVGEMEAEVAIDRHHDPRESFEIDRIRYLTHTQLVVHERWARLYNEFEHFRLQQALSEHLLL